MPKIKLLMKSAEIVSAFASNNTIKASEIPDLLEQIANKMFALAGEGGTPKPVPAVPIDESYTDEYIICLEDGKKVTLLKRYLTKNFDTTLEEYREKWGLPDDYPVVTKSYSEKRSKIAKKSGLGKSA